MSHRNGNSPDIEEYTQEFFGERWDVPMMENARQVPTPVARLCAHCDEEIRAGQQGVMRVHVGMEGSRLKPVHRECDVRALVGGVYHLRGLCICQGGNMDPDPAWATRREAALLAFGYLLATGGAL